MPLDVVRGSSLPVSIVVETEGTVSNYEIKVNDTYIPLTNKKANDFPVIFNGVPIKIEGRFTGHPESKIKKFEVKINGKTKAYKDKTLTTGEIRISDNPHYITFGLNDVHS
jgi:hypothetical protein